MRLTGAPIFWRGKPLALRTEWGGGASSGASAQALSWRNCLVPISKFFEAKKLSEILSTKRGPGRPKGSKNKKTLLREELFSHCLKEAGIIIVSELKPLLKALVRKSKEGDVSAAKVLLDRCIPARKAIDKTETTSNTWEFRVAAVAPEKVIEGEAIHSIPSFSKKH